MISTNFDHQRRTGRIVLRPNASWTWRANLVLLATLAMTSLVIAGSFLLRGLWMILPYSVLEVSVVGACLYYCVRRTHRQEVITFDPLEVCIERGHRHAEERYVYNRQWSRFLVRRPCHPWYEPTISIRSHGQELAIGDFLNRRDKARLTRELRRIITALDT